MGARLMIMAGGTGGHVYPALAVAQEWLSLGHEVVWMGTRSGLEARVVPAAGIPMEWLSVSGLRGKGWLAKLSFPFMLTKACLQALFILRRAKPHVVLGMGGFVSGPGGVMARLLGIPLILHEQNRIPGTTNRWLARRAQVILEAFPDSFTPKVKARCTGNPVRREIVSLRREIGAGWDEPIKILILGGSQGASALNEIVPEALARVDMPIRVFHQTGQAMRAKTAVRYAQLRMSARIEAFVEDMADAYAWADLVVCRSGAMTVSELTAAGLPSILVPYPYAIDDHQTHNARYLVDHGAAVMIPQADLSAERLAEEITALMQEPVRLKAMAERASALAKPDAAQVVAEICLNEAGREAA